VVTPPPSPEGWALILTHLNEARAVVRYMARRAHRVGLDREDLLHEAILGMARGVSRPIRPGRTISDHLRRWAYRGCFWATDRAYRMYGRDGFPWTDAVPASLRTDRDFRPESVVDHRSSGVDPALVLWHESAQARRARLDWIDRVILALVVLESYTLVEVGECFGVTRQAISYRLRQAIRTMGGVRSGNPLSHRPRPRPAPVLEARLRNRSASAPVHEIA
jgi:DNA-directed RNA polymerase specialized sigma24 family protein